MENDCVLTSKNEPSIYFWVAAETEEQSREEGDIS